MGQSRKLSLKAAIAIVVVILAGAATLALLNTETGCTFQQTPGGSTHFGQQTYWEKLVGGLCHPLPG